MRAVALLLASLLWIAWAGAAEARRVALVIGNSGYLYATPLKNPGNDGADMAELLRRNGFEVVDGLDLARSGMEIKIREFISRIQDAEAAVLFYAGHGIQVSDRNYLVPIDAKLEYEIDLDLEALPLDPILRQMEVRARRSVVLLDACRNNPFSVKLRRSMGARGDTVGHGLASVAPGIDTLIGFAAAPGEVAYDGTGRNSPYTAGLKKHLAAPGRDLANALVQVRNEVLRETGRRQVPWEHSSLTESYFIAGRPRADAAAFASTAPRQWFGRAPTHVCDRLAAHHHDPHRAAPGVWLEDLDDEWTIRACVEAVNLYPGEPRFLFQLARGYHKAKQCDRAKPIYEDLAQRSYPIAITNLALVYSSGCAGRKDVPLALELYREAVEAGDLFAHVILARHYLQGNGVERDVPAGLRLLETAAAQGHVQAISALAWLHHEGRHVEKNEEKAIGLLRTAIDRGEVRAMTILGQVLVDKPGREAEGVQLIRRAAEADEPRANGLLGHLHEQGRGVAKDEAEALRLYERAAQLGDRKTLLNLAYRHRTGERVEKEPRKAVILYQQAAAADIPEAKHYLAEMMARGEGTDRNLSEAAKLMREAVDASYQYSIVPLAGVVARGEGVARDAEEARRLIARAAASTNSTVVEDAALAYERGDVVPKDEARALALHKKAADAGNTQAMISVARFKDAGTATDKDPAGAAELYLAALERLVPEARAPSIGLLTISPPGLGEEARRQIKRRLAADGLYDGSPEDAAVDDRMLEGLRRLPRNTKPRPRSN